VCFSGGLPDSKRGFAIVFQVFYYSARIMVGEGRFDFPFRVPVACNQRLVRIPHHPPARAEHRGVNQLAIRILDDQKVIYLSTYVAAMLFYHI
jgi:hypothetical protein